MRRKLDEYYLYNGKKQTLAEISQSCGVSEKTLRGRLYKGGELDTSPVNKTKTHDYNGEMLTVAEIVERTGLSRETVNRRIRKKQRLNDKRMKTGTPPRREYYFRGRWRLASDISEMTGMPVAAFYERVSRRSDMTAYDGPITKIRDVQVDRKPVTEMVKITATASWGIL